MQLCEDLFKLNKNHRFLLEKSLLCGCYYCKKLFKSNEIKEWIDNNQTAICPYCMIDSVLPEEALGDKPREILNLMHKYWFPD